MKSAARWYDVLVSHFNRIYCTLIRAKQCQSCESIVFVEILLHDDSWITQSEISFFLGAFLRAIVDGADPGPYR